MAKESQKRWRLEHADQLAEDQLAWQRSHREELNEYQRTRYQSHLKPKMDMVCPECGTGFEGYKNRRFCSPLCGRRFNTRNTLRIRKVRIQNADWETFGLFEIAERDSWTCWLCSAPVTRDVWSIDHILPIAAGGAHVRDNIRLAHLACNVRRGTGEHVRLAPIDLATGRLLRPERPCGRCGAMHVRHGLAKYCSRACCRAVAGDKRRAAA